MDKHKEALNKVIEYCNELIFSDNGCECTLTIPTEILKIVDSVLIDK